MTTVGIDGNEANVANKVGSSVYTIELLRYFKSKSSPNLSFFVYLKNPPKNEMPQEGKYYRYQIVKGPIYWSQIFLPIKLYTNRNIDVFFSPAHYVPRFCPVPTVVTLHDLGYIYYKQEFLKKDLYKLKNWTQHAVNKSCKVITVSKNTANDTIKHLKIDPEKIRVIYNGFRTSLTNQKTNTYLKKVKKPYILFVGTLQPRKNIIRLIEAYSIFKKNHPTFDLVIAGKKGWLYENIYEKVKELNLENEVVFTGFVDDQSLKSLYQNANLFILPGLYEGFGYPMLEAMNFSCPVIASSTGALPEVAGTAAKYFDPKNVKEMAHVMHQVLSNAKIREELINNGLKQVKKFTWEECGKKTLEVILSCVKKHEG